ncbi:MAG: acyl CoA:acetate/3-ketoacid CoA transferase [Candidatus Hydrogenedentes bacterium]|nr:acyl CoA:acetate/3-ketoacid CoA transferase [Candidatus Hydrogenedentota bacterium]
MARIVSADDAVRRIPDGATVVLNPLPLEEVFPAFGRVYQATGSPKDLTVVWSAGIGPFSDEPRGLNHFAYRGMVKRLIGGHFGLNHSLAGLVAENAVEAYNLPQGVIAQMYREVAAKRPGIFTQVGIGTFVDPRVEGGKLNERTRNCEDLVEVVQVNGQKLLHYKPFRADVGIIRGTTADRLGNIGEDDEAIVMENLEVAIAAKCCGGFVIAQVIQTSDEPLHPHHVRVPGIFVDYVVVAESKKSHPHTLFVDDDPSYSGREHTPLEQVFQRMPLNLEKVICRRAAMELRAGANVNLGVGIPMGVAAVAHEEGILDTVSFSTEVGAIGGLPEGGRNFGPAKNPTAFMSQAHMFDFYDGGGLDLTCVGLAQADREGNVNVSKLGSRIIGCGGFINITQGTRKCVFCGEFRAGAADIAVDGGRLVIRREGRVPKFLKQVEQITFSGKFARQQGRDVLFVTERCVFRLAPEGLLLCEIAPGVDLQKDILQQMEFRPIIPAEIAPMDPRIFA